MSTQALTLYFVVVIRSDHLVVQNLGLAILLTASSWSISFEIIAWYFTLPTVSRYGALIGVHKTLVQNPNLIVTRAYSISIAMTVLSFLNPLILPMINAEYQRFSDFIIVIIHVLFMLVIPTFVLPVINSILKVFRSAVVIFEKANNQREVDNLKEAIKLTVAYRAHTVGVGVFFSCFFAVLLCFRVKYVYIFYNTAQLLLIFGLLVQGLTHIATDGGLAPQQKKNKKSKKSERSYELNVTHSVEL